MGVVMCAALASPAMGAETAPWQADGALRVATGIADTATRTGVSFATTNADVGVGHRAKHYLAHVGLELRSYRIETQMSESVAGIGEAYVGYEPLHTSWLKLRLGRLKLDGARRLGSELVTRDQADAFGRTEGLRLAWTNAGTLAGVVVGNTLGGYGGDARDADATMRVDVFQPGSMASPKDSRALIAFAAAQAFGLDLRAWYGREKRYFASAPTVSTQQVAGGAAPDGIAYEQFQRAEVSAGGAIDGIGFGVWFRKDWLSDPKAAAVSSTGELVEAAAAATVKSQWRELLGGGVSYDAAPGQADAAALLAGLSVVKARTGSEGLAKGSAEAKAEEDRDLTQVSLSVGLRDKPVTATLNAALSNTKGRTFSDRDGDAASRKSRSLIYASLTYAM
jgi:hypothetical protein